MTSLRKFLTPVVPCCLVLAIGCGQASDASATHIGEVQGAAHRSPFEGRTVTVRGVVTALDVGGGFVVQDPAGDGDPATSEALVVRADATDVAPGDDVRVTGRVTEVLPGNRSTNLTTTTLEDATVERLGRGTALPDPIVLGRGGRPLPDRVIEDDAFDAFEPTSDGIDYFEALEGMRVRVDDARVIAGTNRFGELWLVADGGADASGRNAHGGLTIADDDFNPERIQVQFARGESRRLEPGAAITQVTGVLDYGYGNYEIVAARLGDVVPSERSRRDPTSLTSIPGALTISTFNVLNLAGDQLERFADVARCIVDEQGAPAIVALQEMQDDDGARGAGDPSGDGTFAALVDAIAALGGPRYRTVQIDPVAGADGGEPGGNIRVGFLYDPARVGFAPRGTAGATDAVAVESAADGPRLAPNPGRVDPSHPSFEDSRKPLAAQFTVGDDRVFVINVHFSSKGGSTPLFGAEQPPVNGRERVRAEQARRVRALVDDLRAVDPGARMIVLGDFNEFDFHPALRELTRDGGLRNLTLDLEPSERWTYVYQGNAQSLDHVLVAGFAEAEVDVVHVHAGFGSATSDHDPIVARVRF